MKQCFFRLDCGPEIGMGHAVRCAAIADSMEHFGVKSYFALNEVSMLYFESLFPNRYQLIEIPNGSELLDLVRGNIISLPSVLVVDHYGLGRANLRADEFSIIRKVLIDDFDFSNESVDIFINPNCFASSSYTGVSQKLLGPCFAPIRGNIKSLAGSWQPADSSEGLLECLISIGATDPFNLTRKVVDALSTLPHRKRFKFTIALSSLAPHIEELRPYCSEPNNSLNIKLLVDPPNMGDLYSQAHCCIGAAGSSAWERSCIGLPTSQLVVADNQQLIQDELETEHAIFSLPHPSDNDFGVKLNIFLSKALVCDEDFLSLSLNAKRLVDGKGADRIAEVIAQEIK